MAHGRLQAIRRWSGARGRAALGPAAACALALALAAAATFPFTGCTADPFDPESVENARPEVRFFVTAPDSSDLHPTSYFQRTFSWSGSDRDGFVTEYHVSIRTDAAVPAPWDTTGRTDTTMTFETDDDGRAEATVLLACRDDRGAMSDTLVRYIPLQNFPPAIGVQSGYEPLTNFQRELVYEGESVVDTVYWNFGVASFPLFALDPDGAGAMEDHYLYTLAQPEPDVVRDHDDPLADPEVCWVRTPFTGTDEVKRFTIHVDTEIAGERALTVKVSDEAGTETRFVYPWEVRLPASEVLFVADTAPTATQQFYADFADGFFGPGGWDVYRFWIGFPDDPQVFLDSLRRFAVVVWYDGGSTSQYFQAAAERNGSLQEFVDPTDGAPAGRLLVISRGVCGGSSDLPNPFIQQVLGISPTGSPASGLEFEPGHTALGAQPHLPDITAVTDRGRGIGIAPLTGTEVLYQLEECQRCYTSRPPWDPIVAVRRPARTQETLARVATVSIQLEHWDPDETAAALSAILTEELGVTQP